jgi:CheY-like chemotaxis protein
MGKRILLADDSVTIHKVVELTFLDEDYSVEAVSNGDEAIARLAGEAPDLVIADVHMPPGPSGYEVCDKVREMHPGVPVLLLAGAFEAFDEERAAAADSYLKKPFDSQRLLQTVQELMAGGEDQPSEAPAAEAAPEEAPEEAPEAEEATTEEATAALDTPAGAGLSATEVDAIARRVVELIGDDVVREVAWEVVPDLAEVVVKDRLRELEGPAE